jgi:hypothetical protein
LWPILGEAPSDLLYISRTSLPTLFAPGLSGVVCGKPPPGLPAQPHRSLVNDLKKRALSLLVAHRPTHIIFDFIDERFDLLAVGDSLVMHSWELDVSGYLHQPAFEGARTVARTSPACDRLWAEAALEMAAFIQATPLREATLIMHEAQWADRYRDEAGELHAFDPVVDILDGRLASLEDRNALLRRYQETFSRLTPGLARVSAPDDLRIADAEHQWGLSPFHYVADYYREIGRQLADLGI